MRQAVAWLSSGALLALGLVACRMPQPGAGPGIAVDPAAALAVVRQREGRIESLRARFRAKTQRGSERHEANGVLLVRKPDQFRLRMMLPFGLTVFDYVSWGPRAQMALPLEGRVLNAAESARAPEFAAFSRQDLGQAFLRGDNAFPGTCVARGDATAGVIARCTDGAGALLRLIRIDAQQLSIRDETSYVDERPHLVIRYGAYRDADGTKLPYEISLAYPGQQLQVDIAIERYEVNPVLSEDLFQPTGGWLGS